jgi:hypothetical protein
MPEVTMPEVESETKPTAIDKDEATITLEHMSLIESEFGGFSNVPLSHQVYWDLRNRYLQLTSSK